MDPPFLDTLLVLAEIEDITPPAACSATPPPPQNSKLFIKNGFSSERQSGLSFKYVSESWPRNLRSWLGVCLRFGFNGGSALTVDGASVIAAVNSEIAASVALCGWIIIEWLHHGKPRLVGLCVGAIAGLATVTPAAGFIQPWAAFALGAIASVVCYLCCELRLRLEQKRFGTEEEVLGVHG